MHPDEPQRPIVKDKEQPVNRGTRKYALGLAVSFTILVLWTTAAAFYLPLYTGGAFFILGLFCLVPVLFFIMLVQSLIVRKWLRALVLVVVAPVAFLMQPILVLTAGVLAGRPHAWKAQEDAAPVLAYISREIAKTGSAPADIAEGLNQVRDRSRMRWVWYAAKDKDYDVTLFVASFYYFDPHSVMTAYSSQRGSWTGGRPLSHRSYPDGRETIRYDYDERESRWIGKPQETGLRR